MALLRRHVSLLLALGCAFAIEAFLPLSWSRPYCMSEADGPDYAAVGIPLPYQTYSGVSSMEFLFMPHIYIVNLAVLTVLLWPVARLIARYPRVSPKIQSIAALGGAAAVVVGLACSVLLLAIGAWRPVGSIGSDLGTYREYRPIGLAHSEVDCVPSKFWFPGGWKPRS
jgi:hypothetical protein